MKKQSDTISFRLDDGLLRQLDSARLPFGDSRGQFVRRLVIEQLNDTREDRLVQHITALQLAVAQFDDESNSQNLRLKKGIRRLGFLLLTMNQSVAPQEAKAAVAQLFDESRGD